jgi:hypothetical protein
MGFLPFLILATLAWVVICNSSWPWWTGKPYAGTVSGIGLFGLFALACEILWLVFGVGHGSCG